MEGAHELGQVAEAIPGKTTIGWVVVAIKKALKKEEGGKDRYKSLQETSLPRLLGAIGNKTRGFLVQKEDGKRKKIDYSSKLKGGRAV